MIEDLSLFMADFGVDATLAGNAVRAIVDTDTFVDTEVATQQPSALVKATQASTAAPGQTFVANAVSYTVRQVLQEPPDGAFVRLILVRS